MKILKASVYNNMDMQKYNERIRKWHNSKSKNNIPQIAFVGFRKKDGDFKNYGYVACGDNWAKWYKSKSEAIASEIINS